MDQRNKFNTSRSYSSFCLCFQPDDDDSVDASINSNSSLGSNMNPNPNPNPKIKDFNASPEKKRSDNKQKKSKSRSRKKEAKRILSRILRAVVLETFLTKKMRSKKIRQDPSRSNSTISEIGSVRKLTTREDEVKVDEKVSISPSCRSSLSTNYSSITNSSFSSSRFSSVKSKSSRSNSFEFKTTNNFNDAKEKESERRKVVGRSGYSSINGLYLLLISLLVLIFWGRVCAILCTSTWVYFGQKRRRIGEEEGEEEAGVEEKEKLVEIESKEYKKRVIMEGLLERNHSRA